MRKSTFEQRMRSYIIMVILTCVFLSTTAGFINTSSAVPLDLPIIEEVVNGDLLETVVMDDFELGETVDEYDGKIVIATAREVITMTIVDGVKHFTNHLIG